mmetsp:Transcript_31875/g.63115  ORF Transcript_31875/g.63115 Transcript_31875/m.63115 type:complete len:213 (+) Transcript_31875:541-1179(+)
MCTSRKSSCSSFYSKEHLYVWLTRSLLPSFLASFLSLGFLSHSIPCMCLFLPHCLSPHILGFCLKFLFFSVLSMSEVSFSLVRLPLFLFSSRVWGGCFAERRDFFFAPSFCFGAFILHFDCFSLLFLFLGDVPVAFFCRLFLKKERKACRQTSRNEGRELWVLPLRLHAWQIEKGVGQKRRQQTNAPAHRDRERERATERGCGWGRERKACG